jgi:hypothetical protein
MAPSTVDVREKLIEQATDDSLHDDMAVRSAAFKRLNG